MLSDCIFNGIITESKFWKGFSIISAMPGPLINFSVYLGAAIDGPTGAVSGYLG